MHIHSTGAFVEMVSEGIPIAWTDLLVPVKKGIQMLQMLRKVVCLLYKIVCIFFEPEYYVTKMPETTN